MNDQNKLEEQADDIWYSVEEIAKKIIKSTGSIVSSRFSSQQGPIHWCSSISMEKKSDAVFPQMPPGCPESIWR